MSLPDIKSIQVLKGPQGTLYGRNTLGGAILITTRQPEVAGEGEGTIEAHVGTDGRKDLIASVNGPLVDGRLGGKLAVATYNSDGYGKDLFNGTKLGNEHRYMVRGGLRYRVSSDLDITFDADYTRQAQNPPVSAAIRYFTGSPLVPLYNHLVAPAADVALGLPAGSTYSAQFVPGNPYENYSGSPMRDNFSAGGGSITVNYAPSPAFHFKSITAVRAIKVDIAVDGDQQPYSIVADATKEDDLQMSEELQFSGKVLDNRLNYVAGIYAYSEHGHSVENLQIFHGLYEATHVPGLALDGETHQHLKVTNFAAYTQETYALTPTLNLTAGVRVNYEKKDYSAYELAPQLGTLSEPYSAASPSWTSALPKFGIDWKPVRNVMLYANYAVGFKSGGISPPTGKLAATPYQPEKLRTWEGGAKTEWFDHRLTVNGDAYVSTYNDIQLTGLVNLPDGTFAKPVLNGGNAHIWGLELEAVAVPVEGLTLNLSGAYTHARFESLTPGTISALHAYVGERLPDIPDYNATFGAQYVYPTNIGEFRARADVSETGRRQLTIGDPTSYQGAYTLVNARIAYRPTWWDGVEFAIQGTNLMDTLYYTYDQSQPTGNEELVEAGQPREVYFSVRYLF